jgi:creatinine amidohydrolase
MRIADMNWMQVEAYLAGDNRCILPIGSTEQHGQLSLGVDLILAERVSVEAAEPTGVPVYPVMPYGLAPYFLAFPGTVSLRVETLLAVVRDVVASVHRAGFRRILIVNGHGGNAPVGALAQELMAERPSLSVKFHSWWNAPRTWAKVQEIDPSGSHANWMENFPWTRLGNMTPPDGVKATVDRDLMKASSPDDVRTLLGDGSFGGEYQKPDEVMLELWRSGVERPARRSRARGRPVSDTVLIWGAGAIGGTLGAYWARAGVDVLLVDTVAEHVEACRTSGLRIEGPIENFTQVVPRPGPTRWKARSAASSWPSRRSTRPRRWTRCSRTWRRTATFCRRRTASTKS